MQILKNLKLWLKIIFKKMENKLYPTAPFDLEEQTIATIKKGRLNEFMNEKKNLEDLLVHYIKIKKRWTKVDSVLKITGITIGGLAGLTGTILTSISTLEFLLLL